MKTDNQKEEFVYKFEEGDFKSADWSQADPEIIYSYFQSKQQEKIERVKKLKYKTKSNKKSGYIDFVTSTGSEETLRQWGYNQAISDVLKIMEEK